MNQHSVVCFDLTVVREAMGCDVYGFIGMDFLKDCIITIDFAAGRVDFLPPGTARQPAWGESVPFEYDNMQRPRIHAVVGNDLETSFVVDTGHASTGSLDEAALTFLVDLQKVRITGNSRYMAASGSFSSATMRVSRCRCARCSESSPSRIRKS